MKTDLTVAGYIFDKDKLLLIKHKKLGLWLPVGGHIEDNETPDEAMIREAKEEVGLDIKLMTDSDYFGVNEIKKCATPFYVNIHNVGDHNHYCQFYICRTENSGIAINKKEILYFKWISEQSLRSFPCFGNLHRLAFMKYKESYRGGKI